MVRNLLLISALVLGATSAFADGVFMVVKGDVKVEKNGTQTPAKIGMKVTPSDTIIAGADSRAKIVMQDKNVLNISPDTKIVIEKYVNNADTGEKNVTLDVLYGKMRATVNQKYDGEKSTFHVKTPSAVAGVRGTDFISSYTPDSKQAQFVTFEGHVEVGQLNGSGKIINSVMVNPGQTTVSNSNGVPEKPSNVPKTDLAKMDSDSKSDNKNDRLPADSNGGNKQDKKHDDGGNKGASNGNGQGQGRAPASIGAPPPPVPGPAGGGCMFCEASGGPQGGTDAPAPPPAGSNLLPPPVVAPVPTYQLDPNLIKAAKTNLLIKVIYK